MGLPTPDIDRRGDKYLQATFILEATGIIPLISKLHLVERLPLRSLSQLARLLCRTNMQEYVYLNVRFGAGS